MATRRAVGVGRALVPQPAWAAVAEAVARRMEGVGGGGRVPRYFSDKASGRLLSEEERAAENVYIQMEREKLEKLRRKADKDKAEAAKRAAAAKGEKKKGEEDHPS
uniref:ATPase inhibitor n=1 Tax=Setaria italica TaxID=4555 RepID=K3YWZ3_SETIT